MEKRTLNKTKEGTVREVDREDVFRAVPEGRCGEETWGNGMRMAGGGGRRAHGKDAGVQQLDELHILLEEHVLFQNGAQRVLLEIRVLDRREHDGQQAGGCVYTHTHTHSRTLTH